MAGNPGTWRVGAGGPGLETVSSKPNQTQQNKQTPNLPFRTAQGLEARQVYQGEVGVLKGSGRRKTKAKQRASVVERGKNEVEKEEASTQMSLLPFGWTQEPGLEKGRCLRSRGIKMKGKHGRSERKIKDKASGMEVSSRQPLPLHIILNLFPSILCLGFCLFVVVLHTRSPVP